MTNNSDSDFNLDSLNQKIFNCPHCNGIIIVEKLNCGIFRHGIFISNGQQIPPHEKKELCDYYAEHQLIYGCGKPFRIIQKIPNDKIVETNETDETDDKYFIEICEYI